MSSLGSSFLNTSPTPSKKSMLALTKEKGADPEDSDEYRAENIFWVPPAARWSYLQNSAKQPTIGKIVDDAMVAIERDNQRLKGILPKDYARPALDKNRLGELIDLIGTLELAGRDASPQASHKSKDILGRVYEYFLAPWERMVALIFIRPTSGSPTGRGQFASAEGKKGGQFYTPQSVVRLLVEMLAPYKGRIYEMSNAEVRMPNRMRSTSTFEIRQSNFV